MDAGVVFFLFLAIGLFFGFLTMAIADDRGRGDSKLGFFLLGFVFPIIGLIVVLIMDKKPKSNEHSKGEKKSALVCEDCGAGQSVANKKCWQCGGKLIIRDTTIKKAPEVLEVSTEFKYCSKCGAKHNSKAVYCYACGNKLAV